MADHHSEQPRTTTKQGEKLLGGSPSGVVPAPHWRPLKAKDAQELGQSAELSQSAGDSLDELLSEVATTPIPLAMRTEILSSGLNVALRRWPKVDAEALNLPKQPSLMPTWKAARQKVITFGLQFPEGAALIAKDPKKSKSAEGVPESAAPTIEVMPDYEPPTVASLLDGVEQAPKPKQVTRIKPPDDALAIEDRLFYLLQPPLQSWLAGQEMIMPFEPFSYQYEGIGWLFSKNSALLADEMGLGKTMQTITAIRLLIRSGQARRVLLVCPKPLLPNWQREFSTWAEELPFVVVEGDGERRKLTWTMPGVPVLIANYESLVRDFAAFPEGEFPKFDLIVLDEAQRIKNRTSRTAVTARALPRRRSWALTGTPIENRPEELGALYEFLEVVPPNATPDLRQLQSLSKQFILRRTKNLVMKDMPPRLDRDAYLELLPAQKAAYDMAEKEGVIQLNHLGDSISVQHVFELVLRLKQITNFDPLTHESAKLDRLEADMEEIAASGGKAILFSQWTKVIDWLAEPMAKYGALVYHGGVPTKQREPILAKFKEDPNAHILLMSYGTGAVGLNLQFAGYVFLFDRWWNPAIEDQAINRAHRIGCKSQVIVTRFICKDTIEERIDRVLNEKRELFAAVLGEGDDTNVSLSMNASEIFGLFDLKARQGKGTRSIGPKPAA
ncbi:DEAD/DEAH box helicase [Schlesneria paludicola]|uniref:DEAD/DEAH box helicase n=1 Tax=Schlesneria paludicola TaxID=360056 RepID=UPI000299D020|nr:DEAD/DEAH box helicase [Schlesneria paludicola]